ncbi:hypothetical protein EMIT0P100_250002 [Pseudomonas sp. IT-P100]
MAVWVCGCGGEKNRAPLLFLTVGKRVKVVHFDAQSTLIKASTDAYWNLHQRAHRHTDPSGVGSAWAGGAGRAVSSA